MDSLNELFTRTPYSPVPTVNGSTLDTSSEKGSAIFGHQADERRDSVMMNDSLIMHKEQLNVNDQCSGMGEETKPEHQMRAQII